MLATRARNSWTISISNMKKLLFVSMVAGAALFTACGDDSSSTAPAAKKYSCDIDIDAGIIAVRTCIESEDQSKVNTVCDGVVAMFPDAGKVGSECPGKAIKKCEGEKDGASYTAYFYEESLAEQPCDELVAQAEKFGF